MSKPTERILAALEQHGCKPRRSGAGWSARCPAHDDRHASLSIGEGQGGRVLLHCHAGCPVEAVVRAVGLELRDLMGLAATQASCQADAQARGQPAARPGNGQVFPNALAAQQALESRLGQAAGRWNYQDANGELVGVVLRWDNAQGKTIRPLARHARGWRIGAMPEPRPLYGLPDLAARPDEPVVIVEGEKCADAARKCGLLATTSAGGANAPQGTDWSPLCGRRAVILPDHDAAGEAYAQEVARLCRAAGAQEIRILRLGDHAGGLPKGGDLADVLTDERWCGLPLGETAEPADLGRWVLAAAEAIEPWKQAWPEILPFEASRLPAFPTHVLPEVLRAWVEAESRATQTPPDLAGLLALAVCSACVARRVVVEPRPGWQEPVNLFAAVLLEPGNRKSAVFADAMKPLRELETEFIEAARPVVARAQSERRQDEARLRKLEKLAAEKGDADARHQAGNLAAELATQPEPVLPRLIVDDATAEKLGMLLAEQGGRIASMSPEGGVFDLMAGMYSRTGVPQFTVYLMGHSGDALLVDRVTRKSIRVERPALVCAYAMQPIVIQRLAEKEVFRGRGLLARFLYAAPESWVGSRQIAPPPVPDAVREAYRAVVRTLGTMDREAVLYLAPDAAARFRDWEAEIETMLADGGRLEQIQDWGAKLAGATLRLAGVLHCVAHAPAGAIEQETLAAAIEIARYLIPHAEVTLGMMLAGEQAIDGDARYVLRWIERRGQRQFTKSEAQQHGKRRFPRADDIDPALAELERRGYIRPCQGGATGQGPGRPPSPTYEVHPAVFQAEKRSKYSKNSAVGGFLEYLERSWPPENTNSVRADAVNRTPTPACLLALCVR